MTAQEVLEKFRKDNPQHYEINGLGDCAYPGGFEAWLALWIKEREESGLSVPAIVPGPYIPLQVSKHVSWFIQDLKTIREQEAKRLEEHYA